MGVLDLNRVIDSPWPQALVRYDEGGFHPEDFGPWMERNGGLVEHLPIEIVEQWLFRHGHESPLDFIPLGRLRWKEERWPVDTFLKVVRTWRGNEPLEPDVDYEVLTRPFYSDTARALDKGEWDYAPIIMPTPGGFVDTLGEFVEADFILVEGHQRRRYLNALRNKGVELVDQRDLIIETDELLMKPESK